MASTFITPDGQRTFATYLGVSAGLNADDITADLFEGYDILYIEGYLVTLADKCSATAETFSFDRFNKRALPAAKPYAEIEARR